MAKRYDIILNREDFMQKAYEQSWEALDAQMDIIMDPDLGHLHLQAKSEARGMARIMALYSPSQTEESIPREAFDRWKERTDG